MEWRGEAQLSLEMERHHRGSQRYSWVRKYESSGVDGLADRRGRAKAEDELTEVERLQQENRILQAKLKDKEMEIALLKKLRELRGGGWSAE